jgi:hypothetical protein
MLSGVSLASRSSTSTATARSAFSCACWTLASARARNFWMTTSMEATLEFCAMFLYCMRPSFAVRPLRMSTQSSTKRTRIGSRAARGVERKRFEVNISVRDCSAACVCPTETSPSACFRTASGFVNGAMMEMRTANKFGYYCTRGNTFPCTTTPTAARPRCSPGPPLRPSPRCSRACGSGMSSRSCMPARHSRGATCVTSAPLSARPSDVRIDEAADVPDRVREIHPARHPRPVRQPHLHRRRRLRLVHLEQRRHVRPLRTHRRKRPRHAHGRHRRPKPVPRPPKPRALGHIVLGRPLRHDHLHRLARPHVQHRHRRTTRVDLREQPLVLGIRVAVKRAPLDAEPVAPKGDVALRRFFLLAMLTLLCIGIGHKRTLDVVAPQRVSAASKGTRRLRGCTRRRTRSGRPVMVRQPRSHHTSTTHSAARRRMSCTVLPPGTLSRAFGFCTEIPLVQRSTSAE